MTRCWPVILPVILVAQVDLACTTKVFLSEGPKIAPPTEGVYHGAYPDFGQAEDAVTRAQLVAFQKLVGKRIVWAYFSNNWFGRIEFPERAVRTIHREGIVPFIRMMPRSNLEDGGPDPVYTMQRIIDGEFDGSLRAWARRARDTEVPLMVEFGTEVNAEWFPWNGRFNGSDTTDGYGDLEVADGSERFRDAYRHIVRLFRDEGADNITWVYHVLDPALAAGRGPAEPVDPAARAALAAYYPGDEYVDWIGISVYGPLRPGRKWRTFTEIMDVVYPVLANVSAIRPLAVLEFAVVDDTVTGDKAEWISEALSAIESGRYPRIKAVSYWHETWVNEDASVSDLRLDSSPRVIEAYRAAIASPFFVTEAVLR